MKDGYGRGNNEYLAALTICDVFGKHLVEFLSIPQRKYVDFPGKHHLNCQLVGGLSGARSHVQDDKCNYGNELLSRAELSVLGGCLSHYGTV